MRLIYLITLLLFSSLFYSQDDVIYLDTNADVGFNVGGSFEDYIEKDGIFKNYKQSTFWKAYASFNTLTSNNALVPDINGGGWKGEIAYRVYLNKEYYKGFYAQNSIFGGNLKFEDSFSFLGNTTNFDGAYRYFSFIAPEIGYNIHAGKFVFNLGIGAAWIVEFGSKGDVSNDSFDDFVPRLNFGIGLKI